MKYDYTTLKAALMYLERQVGAAHPEGRKDNGGRFYPSGRDFEVLANVREPTRTYPWSYYKACLSIKHCSAYYEADAKAVRKAAKSGLLTVRELMRQAEGRPLPPPPTYQVAVEIPDPSFFLPQLPVPVSTYI